MDAPPLSFPTKDEVADYLERYAATHRIPVRSDSRVIRLSRDGDRFVADTAHERFAAANVIIATGAHARPRVPAFAADVDPRITAIHSSDYRNPAQLPDGGVLVVGCGNSGAEIARDVSASHETWIAGTVPGQIPMRHGPLAAAILFPFVRLAGLFLLTVDNPLGRKAESHVRHHSPPLIRTRVPELRAAGVRMVPRMTGVDARGRPILADGTIPDVASVVWCTGADEDLSFVDLPGFEDGRPEQYRGVVAEHPGLYLLGLEFLYAEGSGTLPGVGRDARYISRHIDARAPLRVAA